jgi:AbrB family looped-hinge helix DNA binding protein
MRRIVISSKGRVTIPADLRKQLGLDPGTYISWSTEKETLVLTPLTTRRTREVRKSVKIGPTTND